MNLYDVIYEKGEDEGAFGISLVEKPAMKDLFVHFNENEKAQSFQFKTLNEEQRMAIGLALQPDFPVFRSIEGEEFYITFSEAVIKDVAHDFVKRAFVQNSTIEHQTPIKGVSVVESWLVADHKTDKSALYGLNAKNGSWVVAMKIEDDEIWNDYVKSGKVKGFSIDGMFRLKKRESQNNIEMSENKIVKGVLDGLKSLVAELKSTPTEVKMGSVTLDDGTEVTFEGESLSVGADVFIGDAPAPDGEHTLDSGQIIVVAEGKVAEIKEPEMEDAELSDDILKELKALVANLKADNEAKETELSEVKTELETVKTELAEATKVKPMKHTDAKPEAKPVTLTKKQKVYNEIFENLN